MCIIYETIILKEYWKYKYFVYRKNCNLQHIKKKNVKYIDSFSFYTQSIYFSCEIDLLVVIDYLHEEKDFIIYKKKNYTKPKYVNSATKSKYT